MKKQIYSAALLLFMFFYLMQAMAQTQVRDTLGKKPNIEEFTVLEKYEPTMIVSAKDRIRLKKERIQETKRKRRILDSLDLPDRKRKKLLKDLYRNPFSERLAKTLADVEFQDR